MGGAAGCRLSREFAHRMVFLAGTPFALCVGMPSVTPTRNAPDAPSAAKLPILVLVMTVTVGLVLGGACLVGGAYLLMRTGRLRTGPLLVFAERNSAPAVAIHTIVLDPILVNLADPSGHAYLRLGLALGVEEGVATFSSVGAARALNLPREREIPIRDTVLAVLGQQTSSALLEPSGKDRLKQELQDALALHNPELKVRTLYFSDFLVQP
jgi:flagellar protein FliL